MNTHTTASTKFRLYFGADIQGNGTVSHIDFQGFLADIVTPRFPGFSLIESKGYWNGKPERTRILEIVMPYTFQDALVTHRDTVHKIARAYSIRFCQDAVMVTEEDVQFSLVERPKLMTDQIEAQEFALVEDSTATADAKIAEMDRRERDGWKGSRRTRKNRGI